MVPTLVVMYDYRLKAAAYPYSAMFGNMFMQEKIAMLVCSVTVVLLVILMRMLISLRNKTGFLRKKYDDSQKMEAILWNLKSKI